MVYCTTCNDSTPAPPFVLEVGAVKTKLELHSVTTLDLVVEQPVEELGVAEVIVDGLPEAELERLEHAGVAKLLEDRDEIVR